MKGANRFLYWKIVSVLLPERFGFRLAPSASILHGLLQSFLIGQSCFEPESVTPSESICFFLPDLHGIYGLCDYYIRFYQNVKCPFLENIFNL